MKRLLAILLTSLSLSASSSIAQEITAKQRIIQFIEDTYKISNAPAIVNYAFEFSEQRNLDPLQILAIIKVESRFNPKAKSYANAHGLMQIHYPSHQGKIDYIGELYDIKTNIDLGTQIWKACIAKSTKLSSAARCYTGGHEKWLAQVTHEHNKLSKLYWETL